MTRHWPALLVAAALTVSAFPRSLSAQTMQFAAHKDYPSGHRPASVAVGDINGDLVPDLALANSGDDSAAVLLGNGDGTFQPPRSVYFAAGAGPQSVAIADFNRERQAGSGRRQHRNERRRAAARQWRRDVSGAGDPGRRRQPQLRDRRRFQRRRQAGSGDRQHRVQHGFRAARQRQWHLPDGANLRGGRRSVLRDDRRRQSGQQVRSGGRQLGVGQNRGAAGQRRRNVPGAGASSPLATRSVSGRWPSATSTAMGGRIWSRPTPTRTPFQSCSATAMGRSSPLSVSLPAPVRPPSSPATSTTMASWMWRSRTTATAPSRDRAPSPCCSATATEASRRRGPSRSGACRGPWRSATSTGMARRIWRPPTRPPRPSRCCWATAMAISLRRSPSPSATTPRGWRPGTSTAMADGIWRSPMRDPTPSPCCSATAMGPFSNR